MWSVLNHASVGIQYLLGSFGFPAGGWLPHHSEAGLYTGPFASGGAWAEAYQSALEMVAKMDLAEKVSHSTARAVVVYGGLETG